MLKVCICELRIISELHPILYIGKYNLFFQVSIPPLGFQTYFLVASSAESDTYLLFFFYSLQFLSHLHKYSSFILNRKTYETTVGADTVLSNGYLSVTISGSTGLVSNVNNIPSSLSVQVNQNVWSSLPPVLCSFNTSVPILLSSF